MSQCTYKHSALNSSMPEGNSFFIAHVLLRAMSASFDRSYSLPCSSPSHDSHADEFV